MKNATKILLIVNPISGDRDKDEMITDIEKYLNDNNYELKVHKTDGKNDAEKITRTIKEHQPERLLVAGGDGTVKMVAELLEDTEISVGIIPVGSANGLATNLGIEGDLSEVLNIALGEHFIQMDTILIDNHLSLHIADLGLNATLIKNYENSNIRGKLGYMLNSIPTLTKTDYPFSFEINANGETIREEGILLAIANANSFGTGANINPSGKVNDGKFEVLVFKKLDLLEIAKTLYGDNTINEEFVRTIKTTEAKIRCEKKVDFQVDGEYIGEVTEVEARLGSKKLKLAVPRLNEKEAY